MLERYIERGFILDMILKKAEAGETITFCNGEIHVGEKKFGVVGCLYTNEVLHEAVNSP